MSFKRYAPIDLVPLMGLALACLVGVAHSEEILLTPPASAIVKMPLSQLDPPRGVAAKDWKSGFCSNWDDGCTHCTQFSKDSPMTCAANKQAGVCERHAVLCFGEIDHEQFLRACKFPAYERYWKTKGGQLVVESTTRRVDWISDVNGVFPTDNSLGATSGSNTFLAIPDTSYFFIPPEGYKRWDGHEALPLDRPAFGADLHGVRCGGTYDQK